jgi:DNA repair exonuclease SbcCD nuclease subunit
MKLLIYSDIHWNTHSSLVRSRGDKYSTRLEHLVTSMNWINETAEANNCTYAICAGDFMDKIQLTDEELTALRDIQWSDKVRHYFLCGNHESSVSDLRYSSIKALEAPDRVIIDKLTTLKTLYYDILFIPYIVESDRLDLEHYVKKGEITRTKDKPFIIISHNDMAGINYAGFESKLGFHVKEIAESCDLYLNGHLHNSEYITKNILNVGSSMAHNFTNNSAMYKYGIWILDTATLDLQFIENPFGFSFYKFEILDSSDLVALTKIKNNAVLSIRCVESFISEVKNTLDGLKEKILESRLTVIKQYEQEEGSEISISALQSDHLGKFIDFCKANINNSQILEAELAEICK